MKLLKICQETQIDVKSLRQKIDFLEDIIKNQKEKIQKLNNSKKSFKGFKNHKMNIDWIEVLLNQYLNRLFFFFINLLIK